MEKKQQKRIAAMQEPCASGSAPSRMQEQICLPSMRPAKPWPLQFCLTFTFFRASLEQFCLTFA
jgi:hypothetical protein